MESLILKFSQPFGLWIILSLFVYALVEMADGWLKSIPSFLDRGLFEDGFSGKTKRLLNSGLGYVLAWTFDFRIGNLIFKATDNGAFPKHLDYLLCAALIYVGARQIYRYISSATKNLKGEKDE